MAKRFEISSVETTCIKKDRKLKKLFMQNSGNQPLYISTNKNDRNGIRLPAGHSAEIQTKKQLYCWTLANKAELMLEIF